MGVPRVHKREEIFNKFFEWSKLESSWSINEFLSDQDLGYQELSKWSLEDPVLREIYKRVLAKLAWRREQVMRKNEMNAGVYQRHQGAYDRHLREYERAEKEFDAALKNGASDQKEIHVHVTNYSDKKDDKS